MKRDIVRLKPVLAAAFLLAAAPLASAQSALERSPVTIAIVAEASIDDTIVRVEQIANLRGGSAELRSRIARLDVGELTLAADRVIVSASQVNFRLLLAGLEPAQFKLTGASKT